MYTITTDMFKEENGEEEQLYFAIQTTSHACDSIMFILTIYIRNFVSILIHIQLIVKRIESPE